MTSTKDLEKEEVRFAIEVILEDLIFATIQRVKGKPSQKYDRTYERVVKDLLNLFQSELNRIIGEDEEPRKKTNQLDDAINYVVDYRNQLRAELRRRAKV